jgi:tetratricopeptide (TPR) repeat protein
MKLLGIQCRFQDGIHHARISLAEPGSEPVPGQALEVAFPAGPGPEEWERWRWYWEEAAQAPWTAASRMEAAEKQLAQTGRALYQSVLGSTQVQRLLAEAADHPDGLRLTVETGDWESARLPWELMPDPAAGKFASVSRQAAHVARGQGGLQTTSLPDSGASALKVLAVMGKPGGTGAAGYQPVIRLLAEMCRPHPQRIHLELLWPPDFTTLAARVTPGSGQYHLLLYSGPMVPDPASGEPALALNGPGNSVAAVGLEKFGQTVTGARIPIVCLDAGGPDPAHGQGGFRQAGFRLCQAGVENVLVLPFALPPKTRARFWGRVWESLLKGEDTVQALAAGREDLRADPLRFSPRGGIAQQDWMTPMGFTRAPWCLAFSGQPPVRLSQARLLDQPARTAAEQDCPEPPLHGLPGRDRALYDLRLAFDQSQVVLLTGPGGIGKSAIATGLARWLVETGGFAGPILYFPFQHHPSLAQIYDRVGAIFLAAARTLPEDAWQVLPPEQRRQQAWELLREHPCLMIWDNFQTVTGEAGGVAAVYPPAEREEFRQFLAALRGGQTRILITSRQEELWLGDICQRLSLPGLALSGAQELALKVLAALGTSQRQLQTLPPFNELLNHLQGHPLAIQILAPDLRRRQPDDLWQALRNAGARAEELDNFSAVVRYRLGTLDPVLRQRLAILGLFQGHVTARVLTAMSTLPGVPPVLHELDREDWLRLLEVGAEMGLLCRANEGAYAIPPALQPCFRELLLEVFPDQLAWLERTFCQVCGRAGNQLFQILQASPDFAVSLLRMEQHNLVHAFRLARQFKDYESLKEILCGLRAMLLNQGRWTEWEMAIGHLEREMAPLAEDPSSQSEVIWFRVLGHRAEICEYRRDYARLREIHQSLKARHPFLGEGGQQTDVLDDLAAIAATRKLYDEAERFYLKSLAVKERFGDLPGQVATLRQLGKLAEAHGETRLANQYFQRAGEVRA